MARIENVLLGFVANFFDTLGIGSFASTTAWIKFRNLDPRRTDSGHAQRRPRAADHHAGHHLHDRDRRGAAHARVDGRCGRGRRLSGGGHRVEAAAPHDPDRHGSRAAHCRGAVRDEDRRRAAVRRQRARTQWRRAGLRSRRQLHARCTDAAGYRPVRAVPDAREPARHESDCCVPDHDGLVRVPDARRQSQVHPRAQVRQAYGNRPCASAASPACCSRRSS